MKQGKGFSLIELMIVVAIIGILMAAASYLYKEYINKSKVSEIMAYLAIDQGKFVQWFFDNGMPTNAADAASFVADVGGISTCSATAVNSSDCTFGNYGFEIGSDTTVVPSFKLYMTPERVADVVEWVCSYGGSSSQDGIDLLPKECRQLNTSSATTIY